MTAAAAEEASRGAYLRGILLMLAAGLAFTGMDAVAKHLTQTYPVVQVTWGRYLFHLLTLPLFLGGISLPVLVRTKRPVLQLLRSALLLGATVLFFLAIKFIPLADATAIGLVSPLLVTALSMPLLGETVGVRRWTAVVIGFASVLVIIRPGFGMVHWAAVLPLLVAACFALYQISTRILSRSDSAATTLFYSATVGLVVTTVLVPFDWQTPDLEGWLYLALLGALGGGSHFLMIRAFALAPASLLAPYSYVQLVWAVAIGFLWFGDLPDGWTLAGGAIITVSGIYVIYRERQRAREPHRPSR